MHLTNLSKNMKETKTFFTNGNRLNKGYGKMQYQKQHDQGQYRKKFENALPPSDLLAEYEEMYPGATAKIMDMAYKEQLHRHKLDNVVAANNKYIAIMTQLCKLLLVLCISVITVILVLWSEPTNGLIFAVIAFASMLCMCILTKKSKCRNGCSKNNGIKNQYECDS